VEVNRNQYFLMGLVVLFLGIQFRLVDSFVLNEKASRFVAERFKGQAASDAGGLMPAVGPTPRRTLKPPTWIGWAFMSVGAVLILHSLAMKRPGG
jgi:hypothetical protein